MPYVENRKSPCWNTCRVVPTFLLSLFSILLMIFFPDQSGFVCPVSVLWSLCPTGSPIRGGGDSLGVERAVRIPPLPEHLGDGPGRRLASRLSGREPVHDGRKAACWHGAGFYSQFVLFFLFSSQRADSGFKTKFSPLNTLLFNDRIVFIPYNELSCPVTLLGVWMHSCIISNIIRSLQYVDLVLIMRNSCFMHKCSVLYS